MTERNKPKLTPIGLFRDFQRNDLLLDDRLEYDELDLKTTYALNDEDNRLLYLLIQIHGFQGEIHRAELLERLENYIETHIGTTRSAAIRLRDEIKNLKTF